MTLDWHDLPEGVYAFTSDGAEVGKVGEVDAGRFEVLRGGQRFWLPASTARDISAGKLELALTAEQLADYLAPRS